MQRKYHVLVNNAAGSVEETDEQLAEITEAFAAAGVSTTIAAIDPSDVPDAMQDIWRASLEPGGERLDAIVVAGGDGTISCAAGVAVDHEIVLGVLPMGTFNHFAKDLGMVARLADSVEFLAGAVATDVDVAEVNGRVFVNNASIGVYPQMVADRERIRDSRGWGKIRAAPIAIIRTLHRLPVHQLQLDLDDRPTIARTTPFLFIGNGLFDEPGGQVGERVSVHDHLLGIYVIATTGRWRLVVNAIRARLRGVHAATHTERHTCSQLVLDSGDATIQVALDGEPTDLRVPLTFRARPGALRVLARAPDDAA